MVNNHNTLDLVTGTPADGVIGGLVGRNLGEETGNFANDVIVDPLNER